MDELFRWFAMGKGTLRVVERENVPTGVEASKGAERHSKLLKPEVNKGEWTWMMVTHDKGVPQQWPLSRLSTDMITSSLEIRD